MKGNLRERNEEVLLRPPGSGLVEEAFKGVGNQLGTWQAWRALYRFLRSEIFRFANLEFTSLQEIAEEIGRNVKMIDRANVAAIDDSVARY